MGRVEGALPSGTHENLEALRAALDAADRWDEVVVLGDLADMGPGPESSLARSDPGR